MKPNPLLLELRSYPHQIEISTRFSDIDAQMHLNNSRIAEFYQEARVTFFRRIAKEHGYERPKGIRTLVAHQSIDYLAEAEYPGMLTMGVGVSRIGTSSWTLGLSMFQNGKCAGLSRCVLVYGTKEGPAALPAAFRSILESYLLPADARE